MRKKITYIKDVTLHVPEISFCLDSSLRPEMEEDRD